MKPFSFKIERPKDIETTFKKLKERIEKENGSLSGDNEKGSISSSGVEGMYIVKPDSIEITILKNPYKLDLAVEIYIKNKFKKISKETE